MHIGKTQITQPLESLHNNPQIDKNMETPNTEQTMHPTEKAKLKFDTSILAKEDLHYLMKTRAPEKTLRSLKKCIIIAQNNSK